MLFNVIRTMSSPQMMTLKVYEAGFFFHHLVFFSFRLLLKQRHKKGEFKPLERRRLPIERIKSCLDCHLKIVVASETPSGEKIHKMCCFRRFPPPRF